MGRSAAFAARVPIIVHTIHGMSFNRAQSAVAQKAYRMLERHEARYTTHFVCVADASGEFARDVPYQVLKPRPVVGADGLVADWWHRAWERHGAPQLNNRFTRLANRPMTGYDWSAWMAVKAVAEAVVRTRSTEFRTVAGQLLGDQLVLDGFKGSRLDFRPWDRQLRQPILLTTGNWVIERAPLDGFLHDRNTLDTLGIDLRESRCKV